MSTPDPVESVVAAQPAALPAIDWPAVAAGAAAAVAIGFAASMLMRPLYAGGMGASLIAVIGMGISMLADACGGALAGLMAKRRGALHGALAMVGASLVGVLISLVMMARMGQMQLLLNLPYWLQWFLYAILGLIVGTVAGAIAAKVAAKPSS